MENRIPPLPRSNRSNRQSTNIEREKAEKIVLNVVFNIVQFVDFLNLLIGGTRFNLNRVSFDFRIKIRPAADVIDVKSGVYKSYRESNKSFSIIRS